MAEAHAGTLSIAVRHYRGEGLRRGAKNPRYRAARTLVGRPKNTRRLKHGPQPRRPPPFELQPIHAVRNAG